MEEGSMRRFIMLVAAMSAFAVIAATQLVGSAAAAGTLVCTQTGFMRDGINMTAAQIGGNVTGTIDASGANTVDGVPCNIGVYYDNTTSGNVSAGADISGANYFGVVVNGDVGAVSVNVKGSSIHDIGESPLTGQGSQHGTAVYYRGLGAGSATGTVSGNTITNYQKGGITVSGKVSATITGNTVTGQGRVSWIAQNGIQMGYGAKGSVTGNTVTGNAYTGTNFASSGGILVVGGPCFGTGLAYTTGLTISKNTLTSNDVGVWLYNANPTTDPNVCVSTSTKTNNTVKFNTITNDRNPVTNISGDSLPGDATLCGYQAGVSDLGVKDLIVNNSISGFGYTPQIGGDCTGTPPAFLRFVDKGSHARGVPSNK
jgi:parallel beta-helix repeat protein